MAKKKTFDVATLQRLIADLGQYGPAVLTLIEKLVQDLSPMQARATAEGCCTHHGVKCACDEAVCHQVKALAAMLKACQCCEPDDLDTTV